MSQRCILEVEKKNDKSFVRQPWLRTRRSEIQFDMKLLALLMVLEHRLRACTNESLDCGGVW